jgi:hypothetical protein
MKESIKDFLEEFIDKVYYTPYYFVRRQYSRFKRLWFYAKVIWPVGEWDHTWHFKLWYESLKRLHGIMENGHHNRTLGEKRDMLIAIECLRRMSLDTEIYEDPGYDKYYKKWGAPTLNTSGSGPAILYPREYSEQDYKDQQRERTSIHVNAKIRYKENAELLGKIIGRKGRHWWD